MTGKPERLTMSGNDEMMTVAEMAKFLQISEKTAYSWVHIKGFPMLKVGNCIRIHKGLLINWVKARSTEGAMDWHLQRSGKSIQRGSK